MLIHGGNYGEGVIDFSVNTNPCVTEAYMSKLMVKHSDKALTYPEIDGESLLTEIGETWRIEPSRLMIGNGAIDCLYRLTAALKSETAVIVEPTFSEYRKALEISGTAVASLPYNLKMSPWEAEALLLNQLTKIRANLVVICNPNNPTGHCFSEAFVEKLISTQERHKGYVLIDESFRFFEQIPSYYNQKSWNLLILTSLTKYYGIPGLRVGYLAGNYSLIKAIKKRQMPWNINGVALAVTKEIMKDDDLKTRTRTWYQSEKEFMVNGLAKLKGVQVMPSKANYLLCQLGDVKGSDLNKWLLESSEPMALRECSSFPGLSDYYIRIGLKDHEANERLINKLYDYWRLNHE